MLNPIKKFLASTLCFSLLSTAFPVSSWAQFRAESNPVSSQNRGPAMNSSRVEINSPPAPIITSPILSSKNLSAPGPTNVIIPAGARVNPNASIRTTPSRVTHSGAAGLPIVSTPRSLIGLAGTGERRTSAHSPGSLIGLAGTGERRTSAPGPRATPTVGRLLEFGSRSQQPTSPERRMADVAAIYGEKTGREIYFGAMEKVMPVMASGDGTRRPSTSRKGTGSSLSSGSTPITPTDNSSGDFTLYKISISNKGVILLILAAHPGQPVQVLYNPSSSAFTLSTGVNLFHDIHAMTEVELRQLQGALDHAITSNAKSRRLIQRVQDGLKRILPESPKPTDLLDALIRDLTEETADQLMRYTDIEPGDFQLLNKKQLKGLTRLLKLLTKLVNGKTHPETLTYLRGKGDIIREVLRLRPRQHQTKDSKAAQRAAEKLKEKTSSLLALRSLSLSDFYPDTIVSNVLKKTTTVIVLSDSRTKVMILYEIKSGKLFITPSENEPARPLTIPELIELRTALQKDTQKGVLQVVLGINKKLSAEGMR
ncbi:MAG: hypothetical protein HY399_07895 [Elusimicrobia bacterium]|nr:hypothetical protein [Elusimicrobiota bacterium]